MRPIPFLLALLAGCGALRPLGVDASCPAGNTTSYADDDGDGFGVGASAESTCGVPAGRAAVDGDCDDEDAASYPGNPERCDAVDNDCNGAIDEDLPTSAYFVDADGDGYGDPAHSAEGCGPVDGLVADGTDCDDAEAAASPGLIEICDGIDNDCDRIVDDADDSIDPASLLDFYYDVDGDGYGDGNPAQMCAPLGQYTALDTGDCDEADAAVNPGALETCNGIDDDCDALVDQADPSIEAGDLANFYVDADEDGLGAGAAVARCSGGPGWAATNTDCDDGNPGRYPGNGEVCGDGVDQDCSGGDVACVPIGSYDVDAGPDWHKNPIVMTCLQACAITFGGSAADYQCSTTSAAIDNQAFASGYGDRTYCTTPVPEDYSKGLGYDCGNVGCSYSAYVQDNCPIGTLNWCFAK
jgi:hypothetical protein